MKTSISRVCGAVFRQGATLKSERAKICRRLNSTQAQPIDDREDHHDSASESDRTKSNNILSHPDYFGVRKLFTVQDLFNARVHLGHKEGSLNERMKPYIYGSRLGHLIIDLDQTAQLLGDALNFAAHMAYRDGVILFACQSPQHGPLIETTAKECREFAHTRQWRQGMFTNSEKLFGAMTRLPDLCLVFNTLTSVLREHPVVAESAKMAIPLVGVVDTNCDPTLVTYPVPGNDDSPASIQLYCNLFKKAILLGKEARQSKLLVNSES